LTSSFTHITVNAFNDVGENTTQSIENSQVFEVVAFVPTQIEDLINVSEAGGQVNFSFNYTDVDTEKAIFYVNGSNEVNATYPQNSVEIEFTDNGSFNVTGYAYNFVGENESISSENNVIFNYSTVATWCYQETANVSTGCGGLDTGAYNFTDDGSEGYMYINYTIPSVIQDVVWSIKAGNSTSSLINHTLPSNCFDSSILRLLIISGGYTKRVVAYCHNSTDFELIYNETGTSSIGPAGGGPEFGYSYDGIWDGKCDVCTQNGDWDQYNNCAGFSSAFSGLVYEEAVWWYIK
jgi:hypothetical protein